MHKRLVKMKKEMKEKVENMEIALQQITGDIKQINDQVEILESKTEDIKKET